jgi:hypothetical protein
MTSLLSCVIGARTAISHTLIARSQHTQSLISQHILSINAIVSGQKALDVPGGDTGSGSCDSICARATRCTTHRLAVEIESIAAALTDPPASLAGTDADQLRSLVSEGGALSVYARRQGGLCPALRQTFDTLCERLQP